MKKRLLCILLCLALLASVLPAAAGAADLTFSDMPATTHWSYKALSAAVENGLLQGSGGKLTPGDPLTRGQMAAVINRAFGAINTADISIFTDVPEKKWYYKDVAKAVRMGTFRGSGTKMNPENPISRQEAFAVLSRAFKLSSGDPSALNRFSDKDSVSRWAIPELAAMTENGYIQGSNGKLKPLDNITRAEFAQVMYNMIRQYYKTPGTYTQEFSGNQMINTPDVTLKDIKVDGDLIVGEGAANGDVWLDHVKISGRLVIRGGGENSVHIINGSEVGSILIGKTGDGGIRVRTEEGCRVETVVIDDGHDEIFLEGSYNQVAIATDAPVILRDAEITGLTVRVANADVTVSGGSKVDAVKLSDQAESASLRAGESAQIDTVDSDGPGVRISGEGVIRTARVSGDNTTFDTDGTSLTVDGAEGVTQNGIPVADGQTVITGSGSLPEPHAHSWDNGTQTAAPTCTEPGVMTYRCSCGETRAEAVPALGHEWDAGAVTREPTADKDGEMTFTCLRCGEKKTAPISAAPFVIVLNEGEPDEEELRFSTLEAAMAEAEKHPVHNEPGEDPWTEYAMIEVRGSAVLHNLNLPSGHRLFVLGDLALTGTLTLGPSDYPFCRGMGAACIYIPMFDETSVTLNDLRLCDGADPAGGAIRSIRDPEEQRMDILTIYGARDEDRIFERPLFSMGGFFGERHCFEIAQNLDFAKYFDGVSFDDPQTDVYVRSDVNLNNIDFRDGQLILDSGANSISVDGKKAFGYTEDCALQLTDPESKCIFSGSGIDVFGSAAIRSSCDLDNIHFHPLDKEASVTVDPAVELTLWDNIEVEKDVQFVNNGTVYLMGVFRVMGILENTGVFRLEAEPSPQEDHWFNGRLELIEANLRNAGTLELAGEEEQPLSELYAYNASICNDDGGVIRNSGHFDVAGGTLLNRNIIENNGFIFLSPGLEQWIKYGADAQPVQQQAVHSCSFQNSGSILNRGQLSMEGASLTNQGTITNERELRVSARLQIRENYTLETVDGEPRTDEDWERFWNWDEEKRAAGQDGYWRVVSVEGQYTDVDEASLLNSGVLNNKDELRIESALLDNQKQGVINNDCQLEIYPGSVGDHLRRAHFNIEIPADVSLPDPELNNLGAFVNGVLTGVGEETGGSAAWFRMESGSLVNHGTVTNNGQMDWYLVDYTQSSDARLETYNASGLHIRSGSLTVPGGSFFRNEGYMQICDRYGTGGEKCDLTGFEDFFTTWNMDGNDSNWCDFTAEVVDEEGYAEAVSAQKAMPENMRYNRLDFCDDIHFTRDVTLEDFGDYWLQSKEATAWRVYDDETGWRDCDENEEGAEPYDIRVGSTLTVDQNVTLQVAAGNTLHVDGEWYDGFVSPCNLVVDGTLRTEEEQPGPEGREWESLGAGRVEIWSFGKFENNGNVINNGYFEIRYYDLGHWENGGYVHEGRLGRLPECPVINAPDNAVYAAEVRSIPGLENAVASADPGFGRILIREDCTLTLTSSLTIPVAEIDIEPGSGLIVAYGSTLTLPADVRLWNDGDISIYGDLHLEGLLENQQHLEVGSVLGNEHAAVRVSGELRSWGDLTVYNTGQIELETAGRLTGRNTLRLGTIEVDAEGDASYTVSRFESDDGLIFQVDTDGNDPVRLRGSLPETYRELRLMRNHVDVSQLDVSEHTEITLSDMWNNIRATIGSHSVTLDDGYNPDGLYCYEIDANADAVIRVRNAQMLYENGYKSTNLVVRYSNREYWLSPHIFGAAANSPAVYISSDDTSIEYELRYNGESLKFEKEVLSEDQKTHLNRRGSSPWFTAGQENIPDLELTIRLPEGPTVIFESVPVKPEWDESR